MRPPGRAPAVRRLSTSALATRRWYQTDIHAAQRGIAGPGLPGHNGPVDLTGRLQIKPGTLVAIVAAEPDGPDLAQPWETTEDPGKAGAVIAFARQQSDLTSVTTPAIEAARDDRLAWIAYPKGGQLGTDLNRDSLVRAVSPLGVQPVRQIAIDNVWSALRFRPA